jgi:aryl carrier-like protein
MTDSATATETVAATAVLCAILADVLGVDHVRPQDGFFEVGGDSVLAVRVVARAREAGLTVSVRDLFDHQTAETLAAVISARPAAAGPSEAPDPAPARAPLLTFTDDEFGEFGELEDDGADQQASGTEAEWETIT